LTLQPGEELIVKVMRVPLLLRRFVVELHEDGLPPSGTTPDWKKKAQHYKDKKKAEEEDAADKLAAEFFEWDEEDSKKKQP